MSNDGFFQNTHSNDDQEINSVITELEKKSPNKDVLRSLVVSLRSRPIRWISSFIERDGLKLLLTYLKNAQYQLRTALEVDAPHYKP